MSDDILRRAYAEELKQNYLKTGFKQGFEAGYAKAKEDFERPHGEWIENKKYNRRGKRFLNCSVCHYGDNGDIVCHVSIVPNFCPNCGADMRIKKEGEKK